MVQLERGENYLVGIIKRYDMADINNTQLRDFCNDDLRTISDILQKLAILATVHISTYNARDLGTIINDAGASNFVGDGSDADGRTRVTGGDVFNLVTLLQDLNTLLTQG